MRDMWTHYNNDVEASYNIKFRTGPGTFYDKIHYSFEKGGPYYTGQIAQVYSKGQTAEVLLLVNAGHKGYFQFFICNADGIENPTQNCFGEPLKDIKGDNNFPQIVRSELADDEKVYKIIKSHHSDLYPKRQPLYKFDIVLPNDLTCEHCIFQWRWVSSAGQNYTGCSDITITNSILISD